MCCYLHTTGFTFLTQADSINSHWTNFWHVTHSPSDLILRDFTISIQKLIYGFKIGTRDHTLAHNQQQSWSELIIPLVRVSLIWAATDELFFSHKFSSFHNSCINSRQLPKVPRLLHELPKYPLGWTLWFNRLANEIQPGRELEFQNYKAENPTVHKPNKTRKKPPSHNQLRVGRILFSASFTLCAEAELDAAQSHQLITTKPVHEKQIYFITPRYNLKPSTTLASGRLLDPWWMLPIFL